MGGLQQVLPKAVVCRRLGGGRKMESAAGPDQESSDTMTRMEAQQQDRVHSSTRQGSRVSPSSSTARTATAAVFFYSECAFVAYIELSLQSDVSVRVSWL